MKKTFLLLFLLGLSILSIKAQSTQDYILANVNHAQYLMQQYQLPASIILGVAIHESAAGRSKIAKYLNNHFGVKGANSNAEIQSAYRDYPSVDSSYSHFVSFLQSRKYFNVLFDQYDQYDYKNWARGIQRGGYAASRTWATQVIAIIKKYELFQYDNRPEGYIEPINPPEAPSRKTLAPKKNKIYTIKPGDNLSTIAKKNHTTVTSIMRKNGLKSPALKPGQKIKL
ncbi:glucosaminidase domain-containing protein [Pedobacter insulae]|uniref:Peptidoglycan hydrolase n=1 Tax=Pedobacter insulae TaxID=414048 RepID=A0A1I2X8P1_9SPHI|nr:glucosaminidase domain-containing protein [Pedobacter insulae]SFH09377.1 Flagellum-specific peptidoglycan hydrolase FlgJ [Pedobacter insulae]